MRYRTIALLFVLLLLLAGCMSVQEMRDKRINENLDVFNDFPLEIQDQIIRGEIEIGFSKDMVRLAWGPPAEVFARMTEKGEATVWRYTEIRQYPNYNWVHMPSYYLDSSGRQRLHFYSLWHDRYSYYSRTVARVEFIDGKVTAVERLDGGDY